MDNPVWVDEWRAVIRGFDDITLIQAAKDLRDHPEDEGYFEEILWEIARRTREASFHRPLDNILKRRDR